MLVRSLAVLAIAFAPVAVQSADEENHFKKAKVGDYATYKMTMKSAGSSAEGTLTMTVTAKSDKEVTLKGKGHVELNGMKMEEPDEELKIDLGRVDSRGVVWVDGVSHFSPRRVRHASSPRDFRQ